MVILKRARTILFLFLLFPAICVNAQGVRSVPMSTAKFITGDNPEWKEPSFDDRHWSAIRTGTVWQAQGFPDYHGYAWYRIHVVLPSSLLQQSVWKDSLRLFLAHVNDVDETYLNGVLIGQIGSFPSDPGGYVSKWPAVRDYHIPVRDPAIKWDAENIIAIRVYDGGGTGGIFMGDPFVSILERTDGLQIAADASDFKYEGDKMIVPFTITNHFNSECDGHLKITIKDEAAPGKNIVRGSDLVLEPNGTKVFSYTLPNRQGIEFSWSFTEAHTSFSISHSQTMPYILTPAAPLKPLINNATITGTYPGAPFLLKIAASGKKPLAYAVEGLPRGLVVNGETGIISGSVADSGIYKVKIRVTNAFGTASQGLVIKAGQAIALTPPMGWNSWNCWGIAVSGDKVQSSAQAMIDKGLIDYGWSYINIDDGWEAADRGADSSIRPNEKFSDMRGLGNWLHERGLKFGIYSSPGPRTCGGYLGSWLNEARDAASYAAWGIDYLKYDWCSYDGIAGSDTSLAAYMKPYLVMKDALQQQTRNIVYSLCQYGMKDVWKWGRAVNGQSWRTTGDIEDSWRSMSGIGFSQDRLSPYAGPGHWNDPDMMVVGRVGWGENLHDTRLTPDEQYTHVSLWCLLSAPLLIGCDLSKLDPFTLNLLTNREVLAIDQDELGRQAVRIVKNDSIQVWIKELADGGKAIGIFNMTDVYRTVKINWAALGLSDSQEARDLWRQQDLGLMTGGLSRRLAPHGVALVKIKKG